MKKEEIKQPEKRKGFWYWFFWIIVIFAIINFFNNSANVDDYNYCVDNCVYSLNSCMGYPFYLSDTCIKEADASECLDNLESCVSLCEINYGN